MTDDDVAQKLGFDTYAEFEQWIDQLIEDKKREIVSRHTFRTRRLP